MQGEEQKKLDVLSNDTMVNTLRASGKCAVLVSEELEDAIVIEDRYKGKYCVVFDPLDGSSNIDAGVNIGTIFGIWKIVSSALLSLARRLVRPTLFTDALWCSFVQRPGSIGELADVLRPGSEMVAAGYTMWVLHS